MRARLTSSGENLPLPAQNTPPFKGVACRARFVCLAPMGSDGLRLVHAIDCTGSLLQLIVGTVTHGLFAAGFATAEKHLASLCCCIFYGPNVCVCVRTITERLFCAFAARTPKIGPASNNIGSVGGFLGNNRVSHCHFLLLLVRIA